MITRVLIMASILCSPLAWSEIEIGSVAIYSDGKTEKLIQKGEGWSLWEDERKRLYKRSYLPFIPVLHYQKFPDRTQGYTHTFGFGNPQALKPFGTDDVVQYELFKTTPASQGKKYWRCEYAGEGTYRLDSKKLDVVRYECVRYTLKKEIYPNPKEYFSLAYAPELQLLVDSKEVDTKGNKERRKLEKLLSPEKATAKRIARTVYALRNGK